LNHGSAAFLVGMNLNAHQHTIAEFHHPVEKESLGVDLHRPKGLAILTPP
jgi:hypothetical protein